MPERSFGVALFALLVGLTGCGAGAPTYAECVDAQDCAEPTDTCYRLLFSRTDGTEGEGNVCSRSCAADAECPGDGACLALDGDPSAIFFCAERCIAPSDCYAGFRCTRVEGADRTMQVCLP